MERKQVTTYSLNEPPFVASWNDEDLAFRLHVNACDDMCRDAFLALHRERVEQLSQLLSVFLQETDHGR